MKEGIDSDFDSDGADEMMMALRAKRIAEMKVEQEEMLENKAKGHGQYTEINESEFLPNVTKSKFCVVHFYHPDFERCKIVDHHLKIISQQHPEAKFMTMNAEKSPFFVQKLQV